MAFSEDSLQIWQITLNVFSSKSRTTGNGNFPGVELRTPRRNEVLTTWKFALDLGAAYWGHADEYQSFGATFCLHPQGKVWYSGLWYHVVIQVDTNVSEEPAASTFYLTRCRNPEDRKINITRSLRLGRILWHDLSNGKSTWETRW